MSKKEYGYIDAEMQITAMKLSFTYLKHEIYQNNI
jgi:hypothetical protein